MSPDLDKLRISRSGAERPPAASRRTRLFLILGGAAFLLFIVLYLWGPLRPAPEVSTAVVAKVYPAQAYAVLNASGYVVAQRKAAVSSKSTGRLAFLGVEEGSRLKKGEVLATLENEDLVAARDQSQAQINEAKAGLAQAQAEQHDAQLQYDRYKTLVAKDLVARQDYDTAVARLDKAKAGVAAARARINTAKAGLANAQASLEYSYIRSPFDGVVLTKYAEVGEVVAPFGAAVNARAAVVTMADLDSLMVEADVAEANLDKVHVGQPCEITLDAIPDKRFPGQVHMIVPTADRSKATVLTKVKFLESDDRILPEMSSKVAFLSRPLKPGERRARLALPQAAVVTRDGRSFAFLLQGNRVQLKPLTLGPKMGDLVEIGQGLKEGDKVVLKPPASLEDGSRVKVKTP
ncbi:MAG: efflux RND transporter periplasmic adaptor subunit [Syntrophales bacterium]|nr:efflux RND transporter periplasmic adaptor subunit [Syntrophales bacterium]MDD5640076.1 efflux RND transporter periplasmic adaptor subunit [Syntrophales bacterium]